MNGPLFDGCDELADGCLAGRRLLFLHVPKTAGTSLRLNLWQAFGRDHVFWHGKEEDGYIEDFAAAHGMAGFARFRVVGGHLQFGTPQLQQMPGRPVFVAVLRQPQAQLVSHFEFVAQRPDHPYYAGAQLMAALATATPFQRASHNLQCRYLTAQSTAAGALEVIGRTPFIVGCVDRIELFAAELARLWAVPRRALARENVQHGGYAARHLDAQTERAIAAVTAEDAALYARVREAGILRSVIP